MIATVNRATPVTPHVLLKRVKPRRSHIRSADVISGGSPPGIGHAGKAVLTRRLELFSAIVLGLISLACFGLCTPRASFAYELHEHALASQDEQDIEPAQPTKELSTRMYGSVFQRKFAYLRMHNHAITTAGKTKKTLHGWVRLEQLYPSSKHFLRTRAIAGALLRLIKDAQTHTTPDARRILELVRFSC